MYAAFDGGKLAFQETGATLRGSQPLEVWAEGGLSRMR
jgi:hypothetical protein